MAAASGAALDGEAAVSQNIAIVLGTRKGTRYARREFGSDLPELIDQPMTPATAQRVLGATVVAIMRWLPQVRLTRVQIEKRPEPGQFAVHYTRLRANGSLSSATADLAL